jgi:hypothetical protein
MSPKLYNVNVVLDRLVPGGIKQGKLRRGARMLRWVESGAGEPAVVLEAALGQPGSLVWAGLLVAVAAHTRVIAYDRAGAGASDDVDSGAADMLVPAG